MGEKMDTKIKRALLYGNNGHIVALTSMMFYKVIYSTKNPLKKWIYKRRLNKFLKSVGR